MRKRDKAAIEEFTVRAFLKVIGVDARVVVPGPDPPDVCVRLEHGAVGIEVTDYYDDAGPKQDGGSPAMQRHGELESLKRWFHMARAASPDLDDVYGTLRFRRAREGPWKGQRSLPPKTEQPLFIKELFAFVKQKKPHIGRSSTAFDDFVGFPCLGAHLSSLGLERVKCYLLDWHYDCRAAGARMTGTVKEDTLLAIITAKKEALKLAATKEDRAWLFCEIWLLVASPAPSSPSMEGMGAGLLSGFTRLNGALAGLPCAAVFLYNYCMGQVVRWRLSEGWCEVPCRKARSR